MSVQRGYYQVPSAKLGSAPSKASNFCHSPLTAVYANCTLSSDARATHHTKPYAQPKIMSPATNCSTQRRKYVSSLCIIPNDKVPKVVILPSIDKDIVASSVRSVSSKIPVANVDKSMKGAPKCTKERKPQAKYISCLHTSLSTEWKKDSFDKETSSEEKQHRTSSLQVDCNYKSNTPATSGKTALLSRVTDTANSNVELHRSGANKNISSILRKNKENTDMEKQTVRVQCLPVMGKSFTIKDTTVTDTKRVGPTANVVSSRRQDNIRQGLRPRMLPKSRFRVKIQKCQHKSINISDSILCNEEKREKTLGKPSRSVVVQDKSPQRSFSVQRHVTSSP